MSGIINMETTELLFFDTFSHDISEELNLDLVQFPKPVFISEVRIIPLGARVQADFPGGVRLGATNPSQFEIEFFVNDLSKPGASTFESLGGLEYKQNVHIQLECERKQIPTDGLVLRGWYTTITLAVYGTLTKSLNNPQEVSGATAGSNVCISGSEAAVEIVTQVTEQQPGWYYENQPQANPTEACMVATPSPPMQPVQTVDPSRSLAPEPAPVEPEKQWEEQPGVAIEKIVKRPSSPPTESLVSLSPESISAEEEDGEKDGGESGAVEPFEPILSDEDIMADDAPSIVEYDCDLSLMESIYSVDPPDLLHLEKPLLPTLKKSLDSEASEKFKEILRSLTNAVLNFTNASGQEKETFVHNCESLCSALGSMELGVEDMKDLARFVDAGLDMDLARAQPQPAYKVRHVKVGVRLAEAMSRVPQGPDVLLQVNAPSRLLELCMMENVALPVKLSSLRALDAALISPKIVREFLKPASIKPGQNTGGLYKLLIEMLDTAKLARLKYALSSLLRKIHVYELLSESDTLTELAMTELTTAYSCATTLMTQPKRKLPARAQIEFEREPGRDPRDHLVAYFAHHRLSCRLLLALSSPRSSSSTIRAARTLLLRLADTKQGLLYLLEEAEVTKLILKALRCDRRGLGSMLAWRLQVVQHLVSLRSDTKDDWPSLKKLHSFLVFPEGLQAVVKVLPMEGFLDRVIPYMSDADLGEFAAEIVATTVRFSDRVEILQSRAGGIAEKSRSQPVLRDVAAYLSIAAQNSSWNYGDVSSLVAVIRRNVDRAPSLPGELVTACRILVYLVFPQRRDLDPMEPYVELKHRNALTQLFAADGLSALVSVMTSITEYYEQPYLHRAALTGRRSLAVTSVLLPCVKLTRAILERLVKCMATDFKDLTAVAPLLGVYSLAEAMPSSQPVRTLSNEIIEALLVFTRAVDSDGSGNVAKSLWTQMLGEVLKMVSLSPCNFVPGLRLLSRLLPPILTSKEISSEATSRALGLRKLWSAHLQAQATNLTETLRLLCASWNKDLLTLLSTVCKQLSDLAAPTALIVGRCLLDGILAASPLESNVSILALLSDLARHSPVKATLLTLMSPAARALVKSDQRYPPVVERLCSALRTTTVPSVQQEILDTFETLCDCTLSLTDWDSNEPFERRLTHSVPSKEPLLSIVATLIEILAGPAKFHPDSLVKTLTTLVSLTSHNYGLYHVKSCLENNPEALRSLLEHVAGLAEEIANGKGSNIVGEERMSISDLTVLFLESLVSCKSQGRTLLLRPQQLASLISWEKSGHPLEKIHHSKGVVETLKSIEEKEEKEPIPEMLEPLLPTPEALLNQFSQRSFGTVSVCVKRTMVVKFEACSQIPNEVAVDLLALAAELLPADFNLLAETQHLCSKAPPIDAAQLLQAKTQGEGQDPRDGQKMASVPPSKTKQPFVTPMRGRAQFSNSMRGGSAAGGAGRGADPFRSRPPNTSRPPSLHVDDFVALETCGAQPTGPTGYNKISIRGPCPPRGVIVGARGRPWLPEARPSYMR